MAAIETQNVTYRRSGLTLVQRVSLCVDRGEFLALLGAPGSGVNTLARLLAGEIDPDAGRVLVDGTCRVSTRTTLRDDPRILAHGPDESETVLARVEERTIDILDRPTAGLAPHDADDLARSCLARARQGSAVVATLGDAQLAARYAHTLAVLAAGRLIAWAPPDLALQPACRALNCDPFAGPTRPDAIPETPAERSPVQHDPGDGHDASATLPRTWRNRS
jgi:ABC-type hemin transport system ATPase subunit